MQVLLIVGWHKGQNTTKSNSLSKPRPIKIKRASGRLEQGAAYSFNSVYFVEPTITHFPEAKEAFTI